ncbi:MAG: M50 family metallopeptidase, partial [Candidatus Pacearchaeota archaeon]|nr:M50 family metallopeptidase [Candidatus Pacearchaeota archaeon]
MIFLFIAIFSLVTLVALHELGHFFLARLFGVKVEEFGFGLPPRLFGKKIGETIYSFNLLPLGAFVRMLGEERAVANERSFSSKPVWQRSLIIVGGVAAFWIIASILLAFLLGTSGIPASVPDTFNTQEARVMVLGVAADSPAQAAGIMPGDVILGFGDGAKVTRVSEVQEAVETSRGTSLTLSLLRDGVEEAHSVQIREEAPSGQGLLGVSLARTTFLKYPWYEAPARGVLLSGQLTWEIVRGFAGVLSGIFSGAGAAGAQVMGPIGIVQLLSGSLQSGLSSFLYFLSLLSLYLALFNILPIPVVDGGRLLFLGIEALRKRPIPEAIEQRIHGVFFILLIALLIWASIQDIT